MINSTNTFIQQDFKFCTNNSGAIKQQRDFVFREPQIKFSEHKLIEEDEMNDAPDMTRSQWRKYYKMAGLN